MGAAGGGLGAQPTSRPGFQVFCGKEGTTERSESPLAPTHASLCDDKPRGGQVLRGLLPPRPFLSHFSDTGAHISLALFLFFPPVALTAAKGPPAPVSGPRLPALSRPTVPADPLLRSALALPRGLSPPAVGTAEGPRRAKPAGRGRSVFQAPLSFHGPLGCVVLPLAGLAPRGNNLGTKELQIPAFSATRAGEARC